MHLEEYWYNTTYHMSIGMSMSPFRALYGYDALTFVDRVFGNSRAPGAKDWIKESQDILRALKDNLQTTHNLKSCTQKAKMRDTLRLGP